MRRFQSVSLLSSRAELAFFRERSRGINAERFLLAARYRPHRFALIPPRPVRLPPRLSRGCGSPGLRPSSGLASVYRFGLRFTHLVGMTKERLRKDRQSLSTERPPGGWLANHHSGEPIVQSKQRLHVFVLIDALGWEIIKDRPFLNAELPVRMPLKTVLGYSSGAIPTLLTGRSPAETGHWNLFYYDPDRSPFRWLRWFSILPEPVLDNRIGRKLIKELGRRIMGMGPLFECCVSPRLLPLFNYVERLNIYEAGGIPGSASIFDLLNERRIPYKAYSYHRFSDMEILKRAYKDIEAGRETFYFLYLSQIDGFLHHSRGDDTVITERLGWYQQELRKIFNCARDRNTDATMTIVSDHGMTPVHSTYDLVSRINRLGFEMPRDYLAVYDSTMARYWFFDEAARRAIIAELEGTACGRILPDAELESLGIFFPDQRYGEAVFLLEPGWLFAQSDFNGGGWNPAGMHGYHPSDPDSDAIFLSNRPVVHSMRTIADIYQCLEEAAS